MKKKYTDLPIRPNGVLPTRRGKHSNSDKKKNSIQVVEFQKNKESLFMILCFQKTLMKTDKSKQVILQKMIL